MFPIPKILTRDDFRYPDEESLLVDEKLRSMVSSNSPLTSQVQVSNQTTRLPPIHVRRCCPSLLSKEGFTMQLLKMKENHPSPKPALEKPIYLAKPSIIKEAIGLCDFVITNDSRFQQSLLPIPYNAELLLGESASATRMAKNPSTMTVLQQTAKALHVAGVRDVKLVGSSMEVVMGSDFVKSDIGILYPLDRTMSRSIAKVGPGFGEYDCTGGYADAAIKRAIHGLLAPFVLPGEGGTQTSATYVDSFADIISTMFNAMSGIDQEEWMNISDGLDGALEILRQLGASEDVRVASVFSTVERCAWLYKTNKPFDADILFFKAHLMAMALDILTLDGSHADMVRRMVMHSHVIFMLRTFEVVNVSAENLPLTNAMPEEYLSNVINVINAALEVEPDDFRLFNDETEHANVSLKDVLYVKGKQYCTVSRDPSLQRLKMRNSQVTALTAVKAGSKTFRAIEGDNAGQIYRFFFPKGNLSVTRSGNIVKHHVLKVCNGVSRVGAFGVMSLFKLDLGGLDFRSPTTEAINECLSGRCGVEASRWVLSAIYSDLIPVSSRSQVTYLPRSALHAESYLPCVFTSLDPALVAQLPVVAPPDGEGMWMVLSESANPMKVRVHNALIKLKEDENVEITSMRKGTLEKSYAIG